MATERFSKSPRWRRIVSMSSIAWVGCAWLPSPALITATSGQTRSAIKCAAPESPWRTTNMSAAMASRFCRVSNRVSPLLVEEVEMFRLSTSAESRLAASSKVVRVRVEFSKNTLQTVLPRSSGTFLTARSPTSRKESAVSSSSVSSSRDSPSMVRKWRSWPCWLSCRWCGVRLMAISIGGGGQSQLQGAWAGQFYPLARRQGQTGAKDVGADRQLTGVDVQQRNQSDGSGAAIIEQLV